MTAGRTVVLLLAFVVLFTAAKQQGKDYSGYHVIQAKLDKTTTHTLANELLEKLAERTPDDVLIIDYFTDSKPLALLLAARGRVKEVNTALRRQSFSVKVLSPDVQRLLNDERAEEEAYRRRKRSINSVDDPSDRYLSHDEMNAFFDRMVALYPQRAEKIVIGKSFEGRSITMLRISEKSAWQKPKFLIEAGLHAREWISHSTAINIAKELVTSDALGYLRSTLDIYVLPATNPDGYEHSRTLDRFWRKNRRTFSRVNGSGQPCVGVDLNRNFEFKWELAIATADDPCLNQYRGPSAGSELETQALSRWLRANQPRGYITLHSYGQYMAHPWGYQRNLFAPDNAQMENLEIEAITALERVNGVKYSHGTSGNIVYPVSGGSDDFAKAIGVKYVYLMELRPANANYSDWKSKFIQPVSEILPVATETLAAIKVVANAVIRDSYFNGK